MEFGILGSVEVRRDGRAVTIGGAKVARQLGHSSSRITALVYEHLLDDALLDDALEAFEPRSRIARPDGAEPERAQSRS